MNKIEIVEKVSLTNREKEVYRTLRTNLEFTGVENKVIAITSCTPNDGKSTVAFYLASALAESGKRTLLIDADLRKSVMVQRFQIPGNLNGLSHLLSGQKELKEVLYSTNKERLYMLPTGVFPGNPTELLGNKRFKESIDLLKGIFDYVIIDTPPLGSVVDAAVVAHSCDASMLVLASNVSSKSEAKAVINQLKSANDNFLGVVLNKVDVSTGSYYGKKYGGYYYSKKYGKNGYYY